MTASAQYRKKLIEVALPLEAINKAAAREKSIRHGHPSTLHLWWARRPLAACRAVLFSSLVDDPSSDPAYRRADGSVDEESAGIKRAELFNIIEELVQWENSNNPTVINRARAEIARCVASRKLETGELKQWQVVYAEAGPARPTGGRPGEMKNKTAAWDVCTMTARPEAVNTFLAEHAPPVLDPFCGGGSIPLEAQRLGLRAYASDLNPVAVLITKALIEIPPKFAGMPPVNPEWQRKSKEEKAAKVWRGAEGLAEDVRYYGKWIRDEAEKRIGHLYPKVNITKDMAKDRPDLERYVGQELTVIAWLWARTIKCPNPACGARLPLVGSMWLSKRRGLETWMKPEPQPSSRNVMFEIVRAVGEPREGTVGRRGATCLCCETTAPLAHVRGQGAAGEFGTQLLAMVAQGKGGRVFLNADKHHAECADLHAPRDLLDTPLPDGGLGFRVQLYGLTKHRDLYSARQLTAIKAFSDLIPQARQLIIENSKAVSTDARREREQEVLDYATAVEIYLTLAISKATDLASSLCHWQPNAEQLKLAPTFMRPTLSMTWDFAEGNPFSDFSGNFYRQFELIEKVLAELPDGHAGCVRQHDAQDVPDVPNIMISTDPPYYDNIGYADLSDFFYVWLRRALASTLPELLSTVLVPKAQELIADSTRHGGYSAAKDFFEKGLARTFGWMNKTQRQEYPLTLFYAFKQAESEDNDGERDLSFIASTGWEVMLESLVRSEFVISGTLPFRTERTGRPRSNASNALASSIVLVCWPRGGEASIATRKQFVDALRCELPVGLRNLQHGNIAPVDLAQAAIGPGMAVFSRYSRVMEADGSSMRVRTALALINQALDEVLTEQESEFDGDTRWALAWFDQHAHDEGLYGDAETLSKAKNVSVSGLVEAGILAAKGGKVRLLRRDELNGLWDPTTDPRLTVWEVTQHLIRQLHQEGESGAAELLRKLGGVGEVARDLAYRLYTTCERKKWAQEALAYNSLVVAWPEVSRLARQTASVPQPQAELFNNG